MKSLVEHINEALINESKSVCGLCPRYNQDKPNQKEFVKVLEPIFQKLKAAADTTPIRAHSNIRATAAIIKATMDILIRNLENIDDDFSESELDFQAFMTDIFDEYQDMITDEAYEYFDFEGRKETYAYIDSVNSEWDKYCKKVVGMPWYQ